MKKILLALLSAVQISTMAAGVNNQKVASTNQGQVKVFKTLKEAAQDYAKVLQEISNYGSREMLKTINADVDKYVFEKGDKILTKLWEETNTMLLEQFEVSVYKVGEGKSGLGDVIFLIKGYDEVALNKYLNSNMEQYAKIDREKGEVEIDIEKYIAIQHSYLKKTKKINLATSTVNFSKTASGWQVMQK